MASRLPWTLRWRLSVLWILEWGITGTILTYLPLYLTDSHLSPEQQGQLMAVSAIGLWVAPFVVGQVADRWLASEKYLAISHFIGGLTLIALPFAFDLYKRTGENFGTLLVLVGLYAVAYFPTVPVATSLSFRHLPDPDTQFGKVRIYGTIGWMVAGLGLSLWLGQTEALEWIRSRWPSSAGSLDQLQTVLDRLPAPSNSDCFRIGAILSFGLSSFCIFLPQTPPTRSKSGEIAPLQTLSMFRDRTFAMLIGTTFLLSLAVPLYTLQVPKLLEQLGFGGDWVPAVMLVGQISEFPALLFLPVFLRRFGLKTTFGIGMAAWFVRYSMFAFEGPLWLILCGLAMHGICHVFLVIVIQLFVDSQCRTDLRASGQNMFTFITMGVGMPLGALLGGKLGQLCLNKVTDRTNYQALFSVPAAAILVLLLVYWKWFRLPGDGKDAHSSAHGQPETLPPS